MRDLVEGEDDGGPIFECSWDEIASSELAESQLAEGNPLSRPKQLSEGGSDRSDDPTQLKPKGRGRKKA